MSSDVSEIDQPIEPADLALATGPQRGVEARPEGLDRLNVGRQIVGMIIGGHKSLDSWSSSVRRIG